MADSPEYGTYLEFLERLPEHKKDTPAKRKQALLDYQEWKRQKANAEGRIITGLNDQDTVDNRPLFNDPFPEAPRSMPNKGKFSENMNAAINPYEEEDAKNKKMADTAQAAAATIGSFFTGGATGAAYAGIQASGKADEFNKYDMGYQGTIGLNKFAQGREVSDREKFFMGDPGATAPSFAGIKMSDYGPFGKYAQSALGLSTSKDEAQYARDAARDHLLSSGVAFKPEGRDEHFVPLADGTSASIGKDGRTTFKGFGGEDYRSAYDIDTSHPLHDEATAMVDPLSFALFGDDEELRSAMSIQLTNAVLSNASSEQQMLDNLRTIYSRSGVKVSQLHEALDAMEARGEIDGQTNDILKNSIERVRTSKGAGSQETLMPERVDTASEIETPDMIGEEDNPLTRQMKEHEKRMEEQMELQQRLDIPVPQTMSQQSAQFNDVSAFNQEVISNQNPLTRRI